MSALSPCPSSYDLFCIRLLPPLFLHRLHFLPPLVPFPLPLLTLSLMLESLLVMSAELPLTLKELCLLLSVLLVTKDVAQRDEVFLVFLSKANTTTSGGRLWHRRRRGQNRLLRERGLDSVHCRITLGP